MRKGINDAGKFMPRGDMAIADRKLTAGRLLAALQRTGFCGA
ncbi:hypothetical protein [Chitinophaga oryzae]|nr:hypothetical protein [Chitinophaga oryzae]